MNLPAYRTARAPYPHRPEMWEPEYLYEPLPEPMDHPEFDLFGVRRMVEVAEALTDPATRQSAEKNQEPMRARMLNEFVYCPRLFYYEQVEGVFVENADTARGSAIHEKVDRGKGALLRAKKKAGSEAEEPGVESQTTAEPSAGEPGGEAAPDGEAEPPTETIHSRSAMMSSVRLDVVAKMDLIEVKVKARCADDFFAVREAQSVTPVDYKAGAPRQGADGNELWDADKMQLGLQILILRDNGYVCDEGVIYYRMTKQRVRLEMTPTLEAWIIDRIAAARLVATSPTIPPPLVNSPKCVRCSLAPVCLPDETRMLVGAATCSAATNTPRMQSNAVPATPRRLIAARDDERALYLNTPGYRVGVKSERLVVKDGDSVVDEVRMNDVTHVALFGNIQISTQAVQELCEQEIPVAYFSMGGWFYGITRGHGLKNVHTRIRQFATAANPLHCLALAQKIVQAKIRNHRTMLMRLHVQPPAAAVQGLKEIAGRVSNARGLDELLGMEGAAAAIYFQHFAGMIKVGDDDLDDEIPGLEVPQSAETKRKTEAEAFTFDFTQRRRRPPTDPVNALLSLAYSLLAKDCTIAALAVGFDPYVGFYHQPRHGRPALALDMMEEFRPLIAESTVLTAINNRMVNAGHFVRAGEAVNLSPHGRKAFFHAYEQRMNTLITHPVFDYKVSYRRVLELQARLLARHLTGEIADYVPMVTR
jgi:CRISPR-associated protein Cas1